MNVNDSGSVLPRRRLRRRRRPTTPECPSVHEIRSAELDLLAVGGGHRGRFSRVEEQ